LPGGCEGDGLQGAVDEVATKDGGLDAIIGDVLLRDLHNIITQDDRIT
jgi:hypothetical protein